MIDLLDKNLVTQIISELEYSEEIDRKQQAYNAYQVYSGNIANYVETELKRVRPKSWKSYTKSDISISKMVVSKLSKAYAENPLREVNSDSNQDIKSNILHNIYKESRADRQFKEFDVTFNRDRNALFWINWREEKQRYEFMALAPYEFSVIRNKDYGDLEAVILQYPDTTITQQAGKGDGYANLISENQADGAAQSKVYAMWTDEHHVVIQVSKEIIRTAGGEKIKKSITYVPIDGNPGNVNPIGVLPFVYMSKDNSPDYPTTNPITDQTITFNTLWSELLTAANIQGSGQLILKYPEEMQGQLDNLTTGLTSAIELPQKSDPLAGPTDATYISPSPDLAGQQAAYTNYLRLVLSEHGITTSQGIDGSMESFSSGIERMIANSDVQSIINENQQTYYTVLEKRVFEIIKMWEIAIGSNRFSEEDTLSVKYPRPKISISDSDILTNIKQMLDLGLIEKWEALQKLDPNLSEEEAKNKLELIEMERSLRAGAFLNGNNQRDNTGLIKDTDEQERPS